LSLPKLGSLKVAESLPQVGRPDRVTLSRDAAGRYHVSFCAEVEPSWMRITHRVVGVDVGLTHLATLSTGEKIPNQKRYHARLKYLRQQQRCLARRQKGSRRREKQRLRVARAHARVRQERQCALHALTTRLVREFDLICIEDLNVKAMARGLHARAIHDVAFSEMRRQMNYKSRWYGKILETVDRWFPRARDARNAGTPSMSCDSMSDSGRARNAGPATTATSMPHGICWRRVFASLPVVMTGTCAWMREMHAQKKTFWCRCSQRKREAGIGIEPVWNRRGSVSSAVK